jgi:hypothetical protein
MNASKGHCNPHAIEELLGDRLNHDEQSVLEEHSGECASCRERLEAAAAPTLDEVGKNQLDAAREPASGGARLTPAVFSSYLTPVALSFLYSPTKTSIAPFTVADAPNEQRWECVQSKGYATRAAQALYFPQIIGNVVKFHFNDDLDIVLTTPTHCRLLQYDGTSLRRRVRGSGSQRWQATPATPRGPLASGRPSRLATRPPDVDPIHLGNLAQVGAA